MPPHSLAHHFTYRLAWWQRRLLTVSGLLLWVSGGVWLLLHYFGQRQGDFGLETHPLESWLLRIHGFALILALLGIGGLLVAHIPAGWRIRRQRASGLVLAVVLALLIVTGYLLYYAGSDSLREWVSLIHWLFGLTAPVFFLWHSGSRIRARIRRCRARHSAGHKRVT